MSNGVLHRTCFTTNFDKLLERAFAIQGEVECQAIRTPAESTYHLQEHDKCYLVTLHGDYDTHNILNTEDETVRINSSLVALTECVLSQSGIVVIKASGQEDSVQGLVEQLLHADDRHKNHLLSYGVLWGVYMGERKLADDCDPDAVLSALETRIYETVGERIIRSFEFLRNDAVQHAFFPMWGADDFLHQILRKLEQKPTELAEDLEICRRAKPYLDEKLRVRDLLHRENLPEASIENYLLSVDAASRDAKDDKQSAAPAEAVWHTANGRLQLVYEDLVSSQMLALNSRTDRPSAVVSSDDQFLTAGGGVARDVMNACGRREMLAELAKFEHPVPVNSVIVTSAGKLRANYVLHTTAVRVDSESGDIIATREGVFTTACKIGHVAAALGIETLWLPLLGAGSARLSQAEVFRELVKAMAEWQLSELQVNLVILKETGENLSRQQCRRILTQNRRLKKWAGEIVNGPRVSNAH